MSSKLPIVLDCTLRDGGYYTNWCYDRELVDEYLNGIKFSGINAIEIGLRTPTSDNYFGPFAYCKESFLKTLRIPSDVILGVMINAKDYITNGVSDISLLEKNFINKKDSIVSLVRIASHFDEVPQIENVAKKLHEQGYQIGMNLMQAASKSEDEIQQTCKMIQSWGFVDVLYFADSMGAMKEDDIVRMVDIIKSEWNSDIGIHAHNNQGQALKNTLKAYEENVSWLDCTVTGMGRGAGNCQSEYLLMELNEKGLEQYQAESLFHAVLGYFSPMQKKFDWGPNLLYYLSGKYDIHPTYVQTILNADQQKSHQLILAMKRLKESSTSSFNQAMVQEVFEKESFNSKGDWSANELINNKPVLIVGSGPSTKAHKEEIINFIKTNDIVVLGLNINPHIPEEFIDAYVACNPTRIVSSFGNYASLKKPLIAPKEILNRYGKNDNEFSVLNYGLIVDKENFKIEEKQCFLKAPLAFPYAFSIAVAGGSKEVFLVGFDGYEPQDPKQNEMKQILAEFVQPQGDIEVFSMTPSTYQFKKRSLYS